MWTDNLTEFISPSCILVTRYLHCHHVAEGSRKADKTYSLKILKALASKKVIFGVTNSNFM